MDTVQRSHASPRHTKHTKELACHEHGEVEASVHASPTTTTTTTTSAHVAQPNLGRPLHAVVHVVPAAKQGHVAHPRTLAGTLGTTEPPKTPPHTSGSTATSHLRPSFAPFPPLGRHHCRHPPRVRAPCLLGAPAVSEATQKVHPPPVLCNAPLLSPPLVSPPPLFRGNVLYVDGRRPSNFQGHSWG